MGVSFSHRGSLSRLESFLSSAKRMRFRRAIEPLAQKGAHALASATPVESGLAANSWSYEINEDRNGVTIAWLNHDVENGFPVVVMLQYGYGTGTGGYVQGRDFINPAIRPIFDQIAESVWKVVTSA